MAGGSSRRCFLCDVGNNHFRKTRGVNDHEGGGDESHPAQTTAGLPHGMQRNSAVISSGHISGSMMHNADSTLSRSGGGARIATRSWMTCGEESAGYVPFHGSGNIPLKKDYFLLIATTAPAAPASETSAVPAERGVFFVAWAVGHAPPQSGSTPGRQSGSHTLSAVL
jgi:hypothetical protein